MSAYDRNQGSKPFMEQFVRADLVVEQVWVADQAFSVERAPGVVARINACIELVANAKRERLARDEELRVKKKQLAELTEEVAALEKALGK